ncbi:hypothetical protein [Streptomyces sp. NBC_00094]|nr:hypothetical protein [Streptomyces sp. NBC_00094]MCX5393861.1 hypothetical protein [Streptomyces sp. NBC_00094]
MNASRKARIVIAAFLSVAALAITTATASAQDTNTKEPVNVVHTMPY